MTKSIGVIFAFAQQDIEQVLSYLITYQNSLQKSFEFRLLPCPERDPFIDLLGRNPAPTHTDVAGEAGAFAKRVIEAGDEEAAEYDLVADPIDKIVVLTDIRFSDNYYYIGNPKWAVIALGGWETDFAPPSIVEYYLSILVTSALDALALGIERHYYTRGCIFDFSASLADKRLSVLSGCICPTCSAVIEGGAGKQFVDDAQLLLKRDWLGDSTKPSAVADAVKKMGFDLFHTTGAKPTFKERLKTNFEQEGVKNLLSFTFQLLLAAAIVVMGLKK